MTDFGLSVRAHHFMYVYVWRVVLYPLIYGKCANRFRWPMMSFSGSPTSVCLVTMASFSGRMAYASRWSLPQCRCVVDVCKA